MANERKYWITFIGCNEKSYKGKDFNGYDIKFIGFNHEGTEENFTTIIPENKATQFEKYCEKHPDVKSYGVSAAAH